MASKLFGRRRGSRDGSLDLSSSLTHLEARLSEKSGLIDEMKKIVPLDVEAPGVIALGSAGSGKSTILEALTGVALPRTLPGAKPARKVLKIKITADPTCLKYVPMPVPCHVRTIWSEKAEIPVHPTHSLHPTHPTRDCAMVSLTDPLCKDEKQTKRVDRLEDLPAVLARMQQQKTKAQMAGLAALDEEGNELDTSADVGEDLEEASLSGSVQQQMRAGAALDTIYVRVLRPSGPTYNVIELPGLPKTLEGNEAYVAQLTEVLRAYPSYLILALVEVSDLFDRAMVIHVAKTVDVESRRTMGVVTKMHLVEKDMDVVEKLQMTSRKDCLLPLGYVAIHAGFEAKRLGSWDQAIAAEQVFFQTNALLRGLKPERWGVLSLKSLVVHYQSDAISQRIPELMTKVRQELDLLAAEVKLTPYPSAKENGDAVDSSMAGQKVAVFDDSVSTFTKLCSEITSMAFDLNELANGSVTRQERKFNLGPRFLVSIDSRETQARRILPSFCSPDSEAWLVKELEQFKGVVTNNDSMMHPIFRKAVREVCFPVLRLYANSVKDDADHILKEVSFLLIEERFVHYPRLAEALKRNVLTIQQSKVKEVEALIDRLLEAELNWVFVSEKDLRQLKKEVEAGLNGQQPSNHLDELISEHVVASPAVGKETTTGSAAPVTLPARRGLRPEEGMNRELRAMQLSLDAYVKLLLKRVFYVIPANVRNLILNEFRRDLVALVAEKYNDEPKIRTLMCEELWVGQKRLQEKTRGQALETVLSKMDLLS